MQRSACFVAKINFMQSHGAITTWIPSLVFIIISWLYAFHLYSSSSPSSPPPSPSFYQNPPLDSRGNLQWKREFSIQMTQQLDLISKRTQVSSQSIDQTLHQLYFDEKKLKIPNGNLFIPRNGIQISADISLQSLHNLNRTKLTFPIEFYPIYGTHSQSQQQQKSNAIIYLISKSSSLESYQQFFYSLQKVLYPEEVILVLPPGDFKNLQIRSFLQSISTPSASSSRDLNLVIYPYLTSCATSAMAGGETQSSCLLYDSLRSLPSTLLLLISSLLS
jgi:hypothetical protein